MKNGPRHSGFTLVEVLVVAGLMVLLLGPIFILLRSGSKTALQGMLQVQTTLDARRIIKQVHSDLKLACVPMGGGALSFGFNQILQESGTAPEFSYSFLSFPLHTEIREAVPAPGSGISPRRASRITYKLEKLTDPGKPYLRLSRIETYHPDVPPGNRTESRILSERVNFFEIRPVELQQSGRNQFYFWVTLQLVDSGGKQATYEPLQRLSATDGMKDVQIADFFDLVYPEFFHAFWNQEAINRNWHSQIVGP